MMQLNTVFLELNLDDRAVKFLVSLVSLRINDAILGQCLREK
jgi:hypothetical protein